jgi:hypothetical protein
METAENIPKMSSVGLPEGQGMAINVGLGLVSPTCGAMLSHGFGDRVADRVSVNGARSTRLSTNTSVSLLTVQMSTFITKV